jgi:hypothetical protein
MSDQIIVLFGAGASKGAATHVRPSPPPLGGELYNELATRFPREWGSESPLRLYADGFRKDFEKTMSEEICLWKPALNILEWQRSMALYFSGFALDGSGEDLYCKLIECLQRTGKLARTTFGSLNYECLFEQAAYRKGYHVDYDCHQSTSDSICVLKLHGSCNFVTEDLRDWRAHLTSPSSHLECAFEYLSPESIPENVMSKFTNTNAYHYPVMSLYSSSKDDLLAPVGIQKIRQAWSERVIGASLVVTVGVRPVKADRHVWEPLLATRARCFYIGSQHALEAWPEASSKFEFVAERFEAFDRLQTLLGC